jgi:acyl-CoA dehydrogenase
MDDESFGQVLDTVRRFVREQVVPREQEIEDTDAIPDDLRQATADLGLFGYALPADFGGFGARMAQDVRLAFEFGYTTPAFRSLFGTNNGIAGQVIAKFGSEEQKKAYLPGLAAGTSIASFALTESEAGSSPAGLRTSAKRDGDGWVLTGTKRFITNAPLASLFVVFARTDPAAEHGRGIGEAGRGYRSAMTVLARGRLHIAAMCVGTGQRVLDESVNHAARSRQGGKPIGDYQLVQAMLAESYAEVQAGRSLVLSAADAYDAGTDTSTGPSAAKLFCSEMVSRVADRGVQVHGGMGYMRSTVVERMYRDSRLYRLYEGTSEIQKLIIARNLLAAVAS